MTHIGGGAAAALLLPWQGIQAEMQKRYQAEPSGVLVEETEHRALEGWSSWRAHARDPERRGSPEVCRKPPRASRELPGAHRWGNYQRRGTNCPKRVESGAHSSSGRNKASLSARVGNLVTHGACSRVHSSLLPYQWGQFSLNWTQPQSWLTRKTQSVSKYLNSVPVQS